MGAIIHCEHPLSMTPKFLERFIIGQGSKCAQMLSIMRMFDTANDQRFFCLEDMPTKSFQRLLSVLHPYSNLGL